MALTTITVTGKVLGPDGTAPTTASTITAQLSQPAMAMDSSTEDWVGGFVSVALGSGGSVPNTLKLVANDALTPAGTSYKATYSLILGSASFSWVEYWSLASSPSTIDIGAITRVAAPGSAIFVAGPAGASGASIQTVDAGSIPSPSSSAPKFLFVTQSGHPTQIEVCTPNDSGGYEWVIIGQTVA